MQNKGLVICIAVLLTLASLFYLSFSVATHYYDGKIAELEKVDPIKAENYKDSVKYLGIYSYQKCMETQIGLGLDLKGGMNVILEISVPDVIDVLADHKTDPVYVKSLQEAKKAEETSQSDFISLCIDAYKKNSNGGRLATLFATQQLKGKVSTQSSDSEVEKALRDEVAAAIENSYNVVRNRIDKFGVVQPNIQKLEGQDGRLMVEMPGIREPERMRKLLQGSANLEFWETYNNQEVQPYLVQLDQRLANGETKVDTTATAAKAKAEAKGDSTQAKKEIAKADSSASKPATSKFQAKATSTSDAAEKAGATDAAQMAKLKKEHPLIRCSPCFRPSPAMLSASWDMPMYATQPKSTSSSTRRWLSKCSPQTSVCSGVPSLPTTSTARTSTSSMLFASRQPTVALRLRAT